MLKQRIITALILAPITLGCVFFLPTQGFALFCAAVIMIGAWEWAPMMGWSNPGQKVTFSAIVGLLIGALAWFAPVAQMWDANNQLLPLYQWILMAAAAWWALSLVLIVSYPGSESTWQNQLVKGFFGLLTLVPAWVAFVAIRTLNIDTEFYFGASLLFASLVIVWAADIGAYFFGKKFGNRKLMPAVSPNKTIEGFLGGLFTVALLTMAMNLGFGISTELYPAYLAIAIVTAIVSAVGDLSESMVKRSAGIKDSGTILPGHGGLLDRIDSLVAAAPVFILLFTSVCPVSRSGHHAIGNHSRRQRFHRQKYPGCYCPPS